MLFTTLRPVPRTLRLQRNISEVITRKERFVRAQTAALVASLPDIPLRPEARPTPWLSPSELETYVYPLASLYPWKSRPYFGKTYKRASLGLKIPSDAKVLGNGLVLGGRYRFTAESGAAGFIEEVKKIAEKEKHNPFALRSVAANFKDNLPEDEDRVETHRVDVKTVTHEAVIPKAILDLRHPNYFPAQAVTTFPEGQLIPGLTLRDIRLAFLIDQMFRDRFLFSTNPAESSRTGLPSLVRVPGKARTESVREIFRRGFCPCCGNLHRLEDCPVRKEYPPRSKCTQCQGEGHWSVDCETNPVSKASVSA